MTFDAMHSIETTDDAGQLPAPPVIIYYNEKPKRRGRPMTPKAPTPALFQKIAGVREPFATVLVRVDTLNRVDLSLVNLDEAVDVDYLGPTDRSLPQVLKEKRAIEHGV